MMARFRHLPLEVDAWRNTDGGEPPPDWIERETTRIAGGKRVINVDGSDAVKAELGDWLVRDDKGMILIYSAEAFAAHYERIAAKKGRAA